MTKRRHCLRDIKKRWRFSHLLNFVSNQLRSICSFLRGYLARIFADFTCLPSSNESPVQITRRVWVRTRFKADNSSRKDTYKQPPVARACTCGMEVVPFMIGLPQWICRIHLFCRSRCIFLLKLLHDSPCSHKPVASTMSINYRQLWLYLFLPK